MIKILAPGTKNKIVCDFCGALLRYEKEDIETMEEFISQRESYIVKYIICPQCKDKVTFGRTNNEISTNRTY